MNTCPSCINGKMKIVVHTGQRRVEHHELDCPNCQGTGQVTDEKLSAIQRAEEAWCKCGNPSKRAIPDNQEYPRWWDCADCGSLIQTG